MWFTELTGFVEESPDQVRQNLTLEGSTITSKINGRSMQAGILEIPSLLELREFVGVDINSFFRCNGGRRHLKQVELGGDLEQRTLSFLTCVKLLDIPYHFLNC